MQLMQDQRYVRSNDELGKKNHKTSICTAEGCRGHYTPTALR